MDKRFRYGTFSTVMMLFAAAVFVLANLLAGEFDRSRDLTAEQIFSLTDESRSFLADLEQDVTLTLVAGAGQELPGVLAQVSRITNQLLAEYAAASPRISVEQRDPMLNPALVHRFAADAEIDGGIPEFSVVVESGGQIRVVQPQEMLDFDFNPFTGMITRITSFNVEREITRAIHGVTQGEPTVVYVVTGSGEPSLPPSFVAFLESENFEAREVNLVIEDVPDDAEILFFLMPARDWTELKAERVLDFLIDEGNAFFALDLAPVHTPNLASVLDAYGLFLSRNLILEENPQSILPGRVNLFIIPNFIAHEITEPLHVQNFPVLMPFFPVEMQIQPVRRTTLDFTPLMVTTPESFARSLDSEAETLARAPGDYPGPFALAIAVEDRVFLDGNAYYTRIIAVGNRDFIDPSFLTYIGEGNWQFALSSLRWLTDQPPGIWVPARTPPGTMPLLITDRAANIIGGIAMGGIPLICLGIGAAIWFKRKNS